MLTVSTFAQVQRKIGSRRIETVVRRDTDGEAGAIPSPLPICHSSASGVAFSIGSPTIVPSRNRTNVSAPARWSVVSREVGFSA